MSLKHITFTGIDSKTDIKTLQEITEKYPIVEFGVLTSYHYYDNGNRYIEPILTDRLRDKKLNLSLHICGSAAHDASCGFWDKIDGLMNGNLDIFNRCQLNVANKNFNLVFCWRSCFENQEIIIQQHSINEINVFKSSLYLWNKEKFSVLLDASGGRGIDTQIEILDGDYKVGYAGGINPDNVEYKLSYLMDKVRGDFWIDMESGVRTNDWFDLEKVIKVLEICEPIIKKHT